MRSIGASIGSGCAVVGDIAVVVVVEKVVAYVVHRGRLLVFTHGNDEDPLTQSGLQVPSGTVEPGEPLEVAVLREVAEETGLRPRRVAAALGTADYDYRPQRDVVARRHFFALECDSASPEHWVHQSPVDSEPAAVLHPGGAHRWHRPRL